MSEGLASVDNKNSRTSYLLHLILFLATCVTTTWAGTMHTHPELNPWDFGAVYPHFLDGVPFSLSIMSILLFHEMGHFFLARWHGIRASLPYFLPVPLPMIGTMGAVIRMEGKVENRNALMDVSIAGPLAGMAVAIPVLVIGIVQSPLMPEGTGWLEGNSLLYLGLKFLIKGQILPGGGADIILHPVAFAGWV